MKRYGLIILYFALFFAACWDDDDLGQIHGETNWLVVEDSDDPIDHQRFEIFQEFDIPVFYNDTIGVEKRESFSGVYDHYVKLQIFYNPGGTPVSGYYSLVKDKNELKSVLDHLQEGVLPRIPETFPMSSILLVDTLRASGDTVAYNGFNAVVIGNCTRFNDYSEENKKWWQGAVLRSLVLEGILSNESEWLTDEFYSQSLAIYPENPQMVYSEGNSTRRMYQACANLILSGVIARADACLGYAGFLDFQWKPSYEGETQTNAVAPTREKDISQFCEAIFALSEEEFSERWGKYDIVMGKYHALKNKLAEYGFVIE